MFTSMVKIFCCPVASANSTPLIDVSLPRTTCKIGQDQVGSSANTRIKASALRELLKRVFDTQVCEKAHVTFLHFSSETSE